MRSSVRLVVALDSFCASASSASTSDRPASSSDTSCWLNTASCSCGGRNRRRKARIGLVHRVHYAGDDAGGAVECLDAKLHGGSPVRQIGVFAAAAGLTVAAVGDEIEIILVRTGLRIHVGVAPGIEWHVLLEVRPLPVRDPLRRAVQRREPFLGARQTPDIETVLLQRL